MFGPPLRVLSTLALFAVVFTGCASADEQAIPSGEKGAYVRKVQPICESVQGEIKDLGADPAKQVDILRPARERLQAIPIPDEDLAGLKIFRVQFSNLAYRIDDAAQGVALGDQARVQRNVRSARMLASELADTAEDNGFVGCTQLFRTWARSTQ